MSGENILPHPGDKRTLDICKRAMKGDEYVNSNCF